MERMDRVDTNPKKIHEKKMGNGQNGQSGHKFRIKS